MLISLKKFKKNEKIFGEYFENDSIYIFFGNKNFEKEHFSFFPKIQFQFLKQVHGNDIVHIDRFCEDTILADAQYTGTKNLALVIQTADCLPVLGYDKNQKWIYAAHAGWRGVENRIIPKTIGVFKNNSHTPLLSIFIGPHIQQQSFQVDEDVALKLKKCTNPENGHFIYDESKNKYYFNLKEIVHAQSLELPIQIQELYISKVDTFTNKDYSSYRRLKNPCRNWSFIYLK
jgi:YfiH family protein